MCCDDSWCAPLIAANNATPNFLSQLLRYSRPLHVQKSRLHCPNSSAKEGMSRARTKGRGQRWEGFLPTIRFRQLPPTIGFRDGSGSDMVRPTDLNDTSTEAAG